MFTNEEKGNTCRVTGHLTQIVWEVTSLQESLKAESKDVL